jgi:hypothetical protein
MYENVPLPAWPADTKAARASSGCWGLAERHITAWGSIAQWSHLPATEGAPGQQGKQLSVPCKVDRVD